MGLEQQQKYIQVTESWYHTGVNIISHGLGTDFEKTHGSSQAQIHMKIKDVPEIDTRIPLGAVEEFCLCVQPGNKCLSESQTKDTIVLS